MSKKKLVRNPQAPQLFTNEELGLPHDDLEYRGTKIVINKHGQKMRIAILARTKESFVAEANEVWNNRYDYTNSVYTDERSPIIIHCPKHNFDFKVAMAQNHIIRHSSPTGCPVCQYEEQYGLEFGTDWQKYLKLSANSCRVGLLVPKTSKETIISEEEYNRRKAEREAELKARQEKREAEKAKRKEEYERKLAEQRAETQRRREAKRAARAEERERKEQQRIAELQAMFLREAPKAQGEGYQYRGVEKITSKSSRVMVHCANPDHEWHEMLVWLCLQGSKCRECAGRHQTREQRAADFLKRAYKKYGHGMFDLSRVAEQYVNNDTYVDVKCLYHDYWYQVTPDTFIRCAGGCPKCNTSRGEMAIILWLKENNIRYEKEPIIHHSDLLCKRGYLKPDFWLPDYNLYIEYNGKQHYYEIAHFHDAGDWTLEDQQERDYALRKYCKENKIKLLEIPYTDFDRIEEILDKKVLKKKRK